MKRSMEEETELSDFLHSFLLIPLEHLNNTFNLS